MEKTNKNDNDVYLIPTTFCALISLRLPLIYCIFEKKNNLTIFNIMEFYE